MPVRDHVRHSAPHDRPQDLHSLILRLLDARAPGQTICPSEAARAVASSELRSEWEPLMPPIRAAALDLVARGEIVITQRGDIVDGNTAKGPIRLRRR